MRDVALRDDRIFDLENVLLQMPQVELELEHFFAPGVYARQITVPAGVVLTGYIHKTEHLCIVSKGAIEIRAEGETKLVTAPATFISKAGVKRAGYAIEDTVWTTIHATDCTDVPTLERELVVNSYEEFDQYLLENKE